MASYNGADYIRAQIDSFAAQTRLPDELIVFDDCSQDSTLSIIQQFARKAPFEVKIFANEKNIGYVKNFSKALSYCSGDIVLLSDQDDVWLPAKLSKLEEYFQVHPEVLLLIHDIAFCKSDLVPIGQTKIERMRGIFDLQKSYVVGMASAIRRDFLKLCLPIPDIEGLTHDAWLHMCAHALDAKRVIEDVLVLHRRHGANVTTGNPLNVDFVTTPAYFRETRPNLFRRLEQMKDDMILQSYISAALLEWLEQGSDIFLRANYADSEIIDRSTTDMRQRCIAETLRCEILSKQCVKRLSMIYKLYRSSGYRYFRGWKSLVSDFVFRCVLRF